MPKNFKEFHGMWQMLNDTSKKKKKKTMLMGHCKMLFVKTIFIKYNRNMSFLFCCLLLYFIRLAG